jgi:RNA:NAD 2'-phosphotransferase (TPT1/KptA family)
MACSNTVVKRVSFGHTSVSTYVAEGNFWRHARLPKCDLNKVRYVRNFINYRILSKASHKRAIQIADKWAKWLHRKGQLSDSQYNAPHEPALIVGETQTTEDNDKTKVVSMPGENKSGKWIADTGSGIDIVGEQDIDDDALDSLVTGLKMRLSTAGGPMSSSKFVEVYVHKLKEVVKALLLPSTPAVLSVGKRVMEEGYSFHWPNKSVPFFILPSGKRVYLVVHGYVPYIVDSIDEVECAPASTGSSPQGESHTPSHDPVVSGEAQAEEVHPADSAGGNPTEENGEDEVHVHSDGTRDLKKIAGSLNHLMTHYPKNPWCPACVRAKMQDVPTHKTPEEDKRKCTVFGQLVTGDFISSFKDKRDWGIDGQKTTLVLYDVATGWLDAYPLASKDVNSVRDSMIDFMGDCKIGRFYSDGGRELIKAANMLGGRKDTATPYRPKSNGIAEAKVKSVLYTARVLLENAGLEPIFWPYAVKAACMGNNMTGGKLSPYFKRHQHHFQGKIIPFGALIDYLPSSPQGKKATPQFAPRANPGVFLGYHLNSGGLWGHSHKNGDYIIAHLEDFKADSERNKPARHRIRAISFDSTKIQFPLKRAYDIKHRSVEATRTITPHEEEVPEEHLDRTKSDFDVPDDESTKQGGDEGNEETIKHQRFLDKQQFGYEVDRSERDSRGTSSSSRLQGQDTNSDDIPSDDLIARTSDTDRMEGNLLGVPKRFIQRLDDPKHPPQYTKQGMLMFGEWVDGEFIRYKPGTTRPPGFTTKGWARVPKTTKQEMLQDELKSQNQTKNSATSTPVETPYANVSDDEIPTMPTVQSMQPEHRSKFPDPGDRDWFNACVARSVGKREALSNPKAKASLDKEWDKLRRQQCWDESKVREWSDVAAEAKRKGIKTHVGRIFDICVEKNAELPENNPNRKFKGRVVFQGNNVKDEANNWAIFSDLSSAPATMQAAKSIDAYGAMKGHSIQQADGESAYTQARLGGDPTWVRLPRERWPPSWSKFKDPVCPLILALYGHPDAGGFWEKHCDQALRRVGFVPLRESWLSVYVHKQLKLFLAVYVDDFKMSGPTSNLKHGWDLIAKHIKLETPQQIGRYLGCHHEVTHTTMNSNHDPRCTSNPVWSLLHDNTPTVRAKPGAWQPPSSQGGRVAVTVVKYNMHDFMEQCVERYQQLSGGNAVLRHVETPFLDESRPEFDDPDHEDCINKGTLGPIASSVLMKCLYAARMARYDLLRPVTGLARRITKWNRQCDKMLHRLMCYINSTLDLTLTGWIADEATHLELVLYCDADLAGDKLDGKSQSGMFFALAGKRSFFPISATSKKQTSVSQSTPEAEIVAANMSIRDGLPMLQLWETILSRKRMSIHIMEDNESTIRVLISGKNPNMRYMSRTQRISITWLNERYRDGDYKLVNCPTKEQAADIFTKPFSNKQLWCANLKLICHLMPNEIPGCGNASGKADGKYIKAVPVARDQPGHNIYSNCDDPRVVIEICCGPDSKLGQEARRLKDCDHYRITEKEDFRRPETVDRICRLIKGKRALLWISIPCTAGTQWQNINKVKPGGMNKWRKHMRLFVQLWKSLETLLSKINRGDPVIVIEWPRACALWKHNHVTRVLHRYSFMFAKFDGCRFGLKSHVDNTPIKKPWMIATNNHCMYHSLDGLTCKGHAVHAPCAGRDTKLTEQYTDALVKHIHKVHINICRRKHTVVRFDDVIPTCACADLSAAIKISKTQSLDYQLPFPSDCTMSAQGNSSGAKATGTRPPVPPVPKTYLQAAALPTGVTPGPNDQNVATSDEQSRATSAPPTSSGKAPPFKAPPPEMRAMSTAPTLGDFIRPEVKAKIMPKPAEPKVWAPAFAASFPNPPTSAATPWSTAGPPKTAAVSLPAVPKIAKGSDLDPIIKGIEEFGVKTHPILPESRLPHEMSWQSYSLLVCEALMPVISMDEKNAWQSVVKSTDAMFPFLISLLRKYGHSTLANQLMVTYYEDKLMEPPRPLVVTPRPKLYVYIFGDSSLSFVEKRQDARSTWWEDTKQTCEVEMRAALQERGFDGSTELYYYKRYGQPTSTVLQALNGAQKYIDAFDKNSISVGIASCMLNELCKRQPGKPRLPDGTIAKKSVIDALTDPIRETVKSTAMNLKKSFRVPIMIIGGNAKIWNLDQKFDLFAEELRAIARGVGVLVVDGADAYGGPIKAMTDSGSPESDGWHLTNTPANRATLAGYHADLVKAGVAVTPPPTWQHKSLLMVTQSQVEAIKGKIELLKAQKIRREALPKQDVTPLTPVPENTIADEGETGATQAAASLSTSASSTGSETVVASLMSQLAVSAPLSADPSAVEEKFQSLTGGTPETISAPDVEMEEAPTAPQQRPPVRRGRSTDPEVDPAKLEAAPNTLEAEIRKRKATEENPFADLPYYHEPEVPRYRPRGRPQQTNPLENVIPFTIKGDAPPPPAERAQVQFKRGLGSMSPEEQKDWMDTLFPGGASSGVTPAAKGKTAESTSSSSSSTGTPSSSSLSKGSVDIRPEQTSVRYTPETGITVQLRGNDMVVNATEEKTIELLSAPVHERETSVPPVRQSDTGSTVHIAVAQEAYNALAEQEVWYPELDAVIIDRTNMLSSEFMKLDRKVRDALRNTEDPEKLLRTNGYVKTDFESLYSEILGRKVFGPNRTMLDKGDLANALLDRNNDDTGSVVTKKEIKNIVKEIVEEAHQDASAALSESDEAEEEEFVTVAPVKTETREAVGASSSSSGGTLAADPTHGIIAATAIPKSKPMTGAASSSSTAHSWLDPARSSASSSNQPPRHMAETPASLSTSTHRPNFIPKRIPTHDPKNPRRPLRQGEWTERPETRFAGRLAKREDLRAWLQEMDIPERNWFPHKGTGKLISKWTRHEAASVGVWMRRDGFYEIRDFLAFYAGRHMREAGETWTLSLSDIVMELYFDSREGEKNRFESWLNDRGDPAFFRAYQGHSIDDGVTPQERGWRKLTPEEVMAAELWHGTFGNAIEPILMKGLKPGGPNPGSRQENHFSPVPPGSPLAVGGQRFNATHGVKLNPEIASIMFTFWITPNEVINMNKPVPWWAIQKIVRIEGNVTVWSLPARGDPGTEELQWYLDDPLDSFNAFMSLGDEYVPPLVKCPHCQHNNIIGTRYCFRCGTPFARDEFDPHSVEERTTYAREVLGLIGADLIQMSSSRKRGGRGGFSDRGFAHNLDRSCRKSGRKYVTDKMQGFSYGDDMITRLVHDDEWRDNMLRHVGNEFALVARAALIVERCLKNRKTFRQAHDEALAAIGDLVPERKVNTVATGKKEAQARMKQLNHCWGYQWQWYLPENSPEKGAWLRSKKGKGKGKGKS